MIHNSSIIFNLFESKDYCWFSSAISILSQLCDLTHSKRNDNKDMALEFSNELIIYDFIDVDDRHLSSFFAKVSTQKKLES